MTLRDYLSWKGLTTAEFGQMVGLSGASIHRISRGEQNLTRDNMVAIVAASGGHVGADDLLFRKPTEAESAAA